MANDFDMLKDVERLEVEYKILKKQAKALGYLYYLRYIEHKPQELEKEKSKYIKQYGFLDNYV